MDFLKIFLRSISLLPSLVQGVEALFGAKSGRAEEGRRRWRSWGRHQYGGCGEHEADCRSGKFTAGLNLIVDGVVECLNASLWAKH